MLLPARLTIPAVLLVLGAAGVTALPPQSLAGNNSVLSPEVQQLCDDFWNWRIVDLPEFATFVGIHDYDSLLDDLSMEAYDHRLATVEEFLERVDHLEPTLSEHADIVNVLVLRDELEIFRDGYHYRNFYMALNNREGLQVDFQRLLSWMLLNTAQDYSVMLDRMRKLPQQVSQIVDLMKAGVAAGITMHELNMNKVPTEIDAYLVPAEQSPIYQQFFTSYPDSVSEAEASAIREEALEVITNDVTPAFQVLKDYVSTEYVTRPHIGATSLPNGTELYAQMIKFHTGAENTPEDIQQLGYQEVDRIEALMQEIVFEMGYNMTVQEFSAMILDDPNNYYTSEDDLLEAFRYIVYNITTPAVPAIFKNIPTIPIDVEADPLNTGAFYLTGSYDGSRPGVFYVGTQDISAQTKYTMLTLSMHEGNPGHHLQGSHAIESPTMPYFRSVMEDRNYGYVPSRFPIRAYYMEGWGLYAESTGFDLDLFGDPLERYGHYSDEIFRACRLVVDTGMHALGWTREEAVDYMLKHTAMTKVDVENEVDRYIMWPAQALSYKTGQLQLSAFRANAEKQLGSKFDIKDFHDVVLESVGPMTLVGAEVDEWIQSVLDLAKTRATQQ